MRQHSQEKLKFSLNSPKFQSQAKLARILIFKIQRTLGDFQFLGLKGRNITARGEGPRKGIKKMALQRFAWVIALKARV